MREELRPWYGRVLTIGVGVICAGVTLSLGARDGWSEAGLAAPWTALLALACWATFWRPRVAVTDAGVQLVNVSRTIDIPWPALRALDTKWALTLDTAYGRFTAWSAPAPGARGAVRSLAAGRDPGRRTPAPHVRPGDLVDTPSGSAAAMVRQRWEQLRAAGHLDDPRLERDRAQVTWHVGTALAAVALVVTGVVVAI
ncbi:MAG: PH domain-containing protein [Actinomycetota bacterium]|nr:PH domain-containing protein [Actinomycetota bacterium]